MARQHGTWISYTPADPSMSPGDARIESVFSNEVDTLRYGQGTRKLALWMEFGETLDEAIARDKAEDAERAPKPPRTVATQRLTGPTTTKAVE